MAVMLQRALPKAISVQLLNLKNLRQLAAALAAQLNQRQLVEVHTVLQIQSQRRNQQHAEVHVAQAMRSNGVLCFPVAHYRHL